MIRLFLWRRCLQPGAWRLRPPAALLIAAAAISLVSCVTLDRVVVAPPDVPGAHFVGNAACKDCHQPILQTFRGSPHARVHLEGEGMPSQSGCESCHGPGSRHVAGGGGRGMHIVNPRQDAAACFTCHVEAQATFNLPNRHPVLEGRMHCGQCHDPHGADIRKAAGGLAMARLNESCAACHLEQSRPFAFEHEALREGCTSCHAPHGSVNAKMLLERDNNLCLKCHAQVQGAGGQLVIGKADHSNWVRQGACWSSGCHTAVHGSNINPHLRY